MANSTKKIQRNIHKHHVEEETKKPNQLINLIKILAVIIILIIIVVIFSYCKQQ